jgi:DNA-binding NarL/FixJ family response regulator
MALRVVLADDHQIVLQGVKQLFERHDDFEIVACCATAGEAIDAVRTHRPHVLVLDLRLRDRSGLDVLRALAKDRIECRTMLLSAAVNDEEVVEALRLGVTGLVLKESPPEVLVECARRVAAGEQWIDQDTLTQAVRGMMKREAAGRQQVQALTPREVEIVRMVARGLRNRAIAERLSISEGTVKIHLHNIYEKCGVEGRLELVLCAQAKGLV